MLEVLNADHLIMEVQLKQPVMSFSAARPTFGLKSHPAAVLSREIRAEFLLPVGGVTQIRDFLARKQLEGKNIEFP